jgi:hypothetical protein
MRAISILALCLALPACSSYGGRGGDPNAAPAYDRAGFYVSAAALASVQQFKLDDPYDGGNSDGGAALRLGYRGDGGGAVELFLEDSRGFELDYLADDTEFELRRAGIQGKLFLADQRFQPYLLLGAGWAQAHYRERPIPRLADDAFFFRGGLGAEWYLSESLAFFAEGNFNAMTKHLDDFDHVDVLAGVVIRF